MTANPAIKQQFLWEAETNWAEVVNTWANELLAISRIDLSGLEQPFFEMRPTIARAGGGILHRPGIKGGFITVEFEAGGHGAAPTGALTETDLWAFLRNYFGQGDSAGVGTTADGTGTAVAFGAVAGTFAAGGICRVGTNDPKDAAGNGQPGVINTAPGGGGDITLYNALDGAPANGAVIYPVLQLYHELNDDAITGFRCAAPTANGGVRMRGCWIAGLEIVNLNPGEYPRWRARIGVSDWDLADISFPQSVGHDNKVGAPVSGGSLHLQDLGTTTRNTYDFRELSVEFFMDLIPLHGPGGNDLTTIRGVRRGGRRGAYLNFAVDKDAGSVNEWLTYHRVTPASQVYLRGVLAPNAVAGRCTVFSFPKLKPAHDAKAPTMEEIDQLNRVRYRLETEETGVATTDLTNAPVVVGMG